MGRLSASLLALLLATVAAVALSACGGGDSSGLLPGATANEINANLDKVQQLVAEGDCAGAAEASGQISGQIEALEGVDSRLKEALGEGAAQLTSVVSTCEEVPDGEEEEQALEAAQIAEEETEGAEKKEKTEKPKPEKERVENGPRSEPPEPPGQEEKEESPATEEGGGGSSGGVGPGTPAGEE